MTTLTQESANVLRFAVDQGIVDNPINLILGDALPNDVLAVPSSIFNDLAADPSLIQNPNQFELFEHPDTRRYQEDVAGPFANLDTEAWRVFECARFAVPEGKIGIVKSFEQVLYDIEGSIYPTASEYWGAPYAVDLDILNNIWYLTLDEYDGTLDERVNFTQAGVIRITQLPGYPYPELSEVNGLWYPAHCGNSNHLNWVVPSGKVLRVFWATGNTTNYTWAGTCRLRGFTQSTFSNDAMSNARRNV